MSDTQTNTIVDQISAEDLDQLIGAPGAGVAMTADPKNPGKPSFFSKDKVDMTVLDDIDPTDPPANPVDPVDPTDPVDPIVADPADPVDPGTFDSIIDEIDPADPADSDDPSKKGGRAKLDKAGMAQLAQALLDDKVILPFDDDKKIEDYTLDDYKDLFKMNFESQKEEIRANTPKEFFQSLPQEMQYAAKYIADGGTDLKGLFKALAASEETKSISLDSESGQEATARRFLQATNFGTEEEIQEQIESWKDLEKLEAKANQFKPKLDAMQDQIVQRQIREQEAKKEQQENASRQYAESIYTTLEKGELNGLKMNNKVQNMLYQGLIQPNYPSVSGNKTNLFGHLIEKHQFVEPNHGLIAEALWLLADPDGYRKEIQKGAKNDAVSETARKLKEAEASKTSGGGTDEPDPGKKDTGRRTIKRPDGGFFKR